MTRAAVAVRRRLDVELVRRGLARSREHAAELIAAGSVRVRGRTASKPATAVDPAEAVLVDPSGQVPAYVSRAGHKLAGALDAFAGRGTPVAVTRRRCLDAGASTGGFTDVLLRRGAAEVVAVDVGYGQLAWSLRSDPRVRVQDRTNIRGLTPDLTHGPVDLAVADLSFISLTLVLPALAACTAPDGDLLVMVKPQFEVGRDHLGKDGVVRDPRLRAESVVTVATAAQAAGTGVRGATASPLPGPAGNVEYFLWLAPAAPALDPAGLVDLVARAVAEGPR